MEELYKKVEDNYLVSNLGKVLNIKRKTFMKTRLDKQGYEVLILQINGESVNCKIHRLVAMAFLPNIENYPQVNHKDGDKCNNTITNLEWCTAALNNQHAFDLKLRTSGEEHYRAKLTKEDVKEIRFLLSNKVSQRRIASMYPVGRTTIAKIANGEIWKHY